MKFLVFFGCCLFYLIQNGNCASLEELQQSDINIKKDLLLKISEKLELLDKFLEKQPEVLKFVDSINELKENVQLTCKKNEIIDVPNDDLLRLQKKINHLDSKFDMMARNIDYKPLGAYNIKHLERLLFRLQNRLDSSVLKNGFTSYRIPEESMDYGFEKMFMDDGSAFDNAKDLRYLSKSCRILTGPYKKLLGSVDQLQKVIKEINANAEIELGGKGGELRNSVMLNIRESLENILDEIQILKRKNEKNINENERILRRIDKKLDSELEDDDDDDKELKKSLKKYMIEQRRILEKNLKKLLKDQKDNDSDDDDDDDSDDDDDDDDDKKTKTKKRGKSKDDSDDDTDDDTDEDDSDDKKKKKKSNKNDSDDDDDDDDDDDTEDNVECDDSDENGSKSCEKEKKAYSRGKKKSDFSHFSDSDDDSVELIKRRKKIRKSVQEIETVQQGDNNDELIADQAKPTLWTTITGALHTEIPQKNSKFPDVTP